MHTEKNSHNLVFSLGRVAITAMLTMLSVLALVVLLTQPGQTQTYRVIHHFTGGVDAAGPDAGLIMDRDGNLYGTTGDGGYKGGSCGQGGCGTVFKLSNKGSNWALTPLYNFRGGDDGWCPKAVPTLGPDGSVYGTTTDGSLGGSLTKAMGSLPADDCAEGCGTVFKLTPPAQTPPNVLGSWTHTVLHHFQGYPTDGNQPYHSPVTFDADGAIYLTTYMGGQLVIGGGTVVKLTPSGGGWTETIIYNFEYPLSDGHYPMSGVILDHSGNLYGTTLGGLGIYSYGTLFELTPSANGWTETILHSFQIIGSDGVSPMGGLISDSAGNLYGTTSGAIPPGPSPTVFEMTNSEGNWELSTLYSFSPTTYNSPIAGVARDAAGNLYGTAYNSGGGCGVVYKLTPGEYGWTYTNLYDFPDRKEGCGPRGGVVVDANGNVYSTTSFGGAYGGGVVFEITP